MKSALLCGPVALLGSAAVLAAPPVKPGPEVTITVVEDPDALGEKVNTIKLPDADEASRAAPKDGRDAKHDTDTGDGKNGEQGKDSDPSDDKMNNHAEDTSHAVGEQGQSDTDDARQDANEAKPPPTERPDGPGGN